MDKHQKFITIHTVAYQYGGGHHLELELRKSNEEFEKRVEERTEKLRQINRQLQTREHEFRTLANSLPDNIVCYDREHLNEGLELRVKERTTELEAKNAELQKMNKIFVGRELRMVELKKRIRELEGKTEDK